MSSNTRIVALKLHQISGHRETWLLLKEQASILGVTARDLWAEYASMVTQNIRPKEWKFAQPNQAGGYTVRCLGDKESLASISPDSCGELLLPASWGRLGVLPGGDYERG